MTTQTLPRRGVMSKAWWIENKSLVALLVLIGVVSFLSPNFFTADNLLNILRQTSVNAIMAVGMTLVILTAGIDLSVGSVLALCGALAATMVAMELPIWLVVPLTLGAGALLGGVSGLIIAKGKVQAFIATLVTMTALRGVTMVYTEGRPISTGFSNGSFENPIGQWRIAQCFARVNVFFDHLRNVEPACLLPQFKWALLHAKSPSHG